MGRIWGSCVAGRCISIEARRPKDGGAGAAGGCVFAGGGRASNGPGVGRTCGAVRWLRVGGCGPPTTACPALVRYYQPNGRLKENSYSRQVFTISSTTNALLVEAFDLKYPIRRQRSTECPKDIPVVLRLFETLHRLNLAD